MELECADLPFQTAIVTDGHVMHKFRIHCAHRIFDKSSFYGHRGSATVPIVANMCQHECVSAVMRRKKVVGGRVKPTALAR